MSHISLEALKYRAQKKHAIRHYLFSAGILEVDVPLLARNACPDPYVEPISFLWQQNRVFLQPSPELFLKRLIAAQPHDMYALSSCFRDDPVSPHHNPEFMMLEFYLIGAERYKECQNRTCDIIKLFKPDTPVRHYDYEQLWLDLVGSWPQTREDYFDIFESHHQLFEEHWFLQDYHDFLFSQLIQPFLGRNEIAVVENFPIEQGALAVINSSGKAERFEVFVSGIEVSNGYHELTHPLQNRHRFDKWAHQRALNNQLSWPDDGKFLASLQDFPACSGVAIGIERLMMLGMGSLSLSKSMPFTWSDC
jgi:lysyl-tRNA synthetase class 2